MPSLNFFAIPLDLAIETNSYLAANVLYDSRLVSKKHYLIASLALLAKETADAVFFQEKLLRKWAGDLTFIANYSQEIVDKLIAVLSTLLKNPYLSLDSKLHALITLGAIKKVDLLPKQYLQGLLADITHANPIICEAALKCLAVLAPCLPQEMLTIPKVKVSNLWKISQSTKKLLTIVTPYSAQKRPMALIAKLVMQLNHTDWRVCEAALNCLITLKARLSQETINQLIVSLSVKINNLEWDVCERRLRYLTSLALYLPPDTLSKLIACLKVKIINTTNYHVYKTSLNCLATLAPHLSTEVLDKFTADIIIKLNNKYSHGTFAKPVLDV